MFGVNDNLLLAVNGNDFSITIRLKKEKKIREIKIDLTIKNWVTVIFYFPHCAQCGKMKNSLSPKNIS